MQSVASVAVFGANGFIGGRLLSHLKAANCDVYAFSSRECDLTDGLSVKEIFMRLPRGCGVVMCATVNRNVEDSFRAMGHNLAMAENLKEALMASDASGLVFLSTVDVYGLAPGLPVNEATPPNPVSYYAIAKLASEQLLRHPDGITCPVSILRLPGIYGAGDRERSIVGMFLRRILQHEEITIFGDGAVLRDYVEVDDVCYVIKDLAMKPRTVTLNVAKGESLPLGEIIGILAKATGRKARLKMLPANHRSAGDLVFDNAALRGACPDLNFTDLETGARRYIEQD